VRYTIDDNHIYPLFISRRGSSRYLRICEKLINLFAGHMGRTYGELDCALEQFESTSVDFKIYRGLAKLLLDQCIFASSWEGDHEILRHRIFEKAQASYPIVMQPDLLHQCTKTDVLSEVAVELGERTERLDEILYGDLFENRIMTGLEREMSPQELLRRYNLALAQGILYRAVRMRLWLRHDFKTIFKYIKLAQLMYEIQPLPSGGYQVDLDGPASILRHTQKYGIHMARFLPGLLLTSGWQMSALIDSERGPRTFQLDDTCGLHTYYEKEHPFDSSVEEKFFRAFEKVETDWRIEREAEVIDLKGTVLIPDFTFTHPDGRSRSMEIVGFWTPEYLEKKLSKLQKAGGHNLLIAINEQLRCSKEPFLGRAIFFKTSVRVPQVLEALDRTETSSSLTLSEESCGI